MALRILSVLYFMTIWGFSPSMVAERFGSQCGQLEHQFFSAENMALKNFVYKNKTVVNHVICGRDCGLEKDCKSFNFYKCRGFCELNNATRKEHTEDFVEDQESLYFDMDEGTPIPSTTETTTPFVSTPTPLPKLKDCKAFQSGGYTESGVYTIYPEGTSAPGMKVYCDMETDGGGWIVFQKRIDGTLDFYKSWTEYQTGFGDPSGEFWLGNDNLVTLTSLGYNNLRVDAESWAGSNGYAKYSGVHITGSRYQFSYSNFESGPADSMGDSNGKDFTTTGRDNDEYDSGNCADTAHGAWWFGDCTVKSHLNGEYGQSYPTERGIRWNEWIKDKPIKSCSMKLR
ncbi:microfibril-associated glycoprotein 4-like [Asterias amurensis]|uniref:microfibril-associated glycoprotein 4-like n=1 Tax=Asterias amurensis TaxID=7602 RepID=UPI003AB7F159